jgi:hypothetical protein
LRSDEAREAPGGWGGKICRILAVDKSAESPMRVICATASDNNREKPEYLREIN